MKNYKQGRGTGSVKWGERWWVGAYVQGASSVNMLVENVLG